MTRSFTSCLLPLATCLILVSPATAESVLLVEYTFSRITPPTPDQPFTEYKALIENHSPSGFIGQDFFYHWITDPSQLGTFVAPPDIVAEINAAFHENYGNQDFPIVLNSIWLGMNPIGWAARAQIEDQSYIAPRVCSGCSMIGVGYVPVLGPGFTGYTIDGVENELQTNANILRVYGYATPVPEPSSWLMLVVGLLPFGSRHRKSTLYDGPRIAPMG